MSSIVGALTGGGGAGVGFQAQSANILNPTTVAQAQTQYANAQAALQQQQNFLQATQAQGGLGAQTQNLAQLNQIAQGQGPNPAQAQLAQATGANVAATQAAMAGQRGSAQNVGLMARQAAQMGAGAQQQAAGQAASLQAQQSLGALGQAGQMANTMAAQQAAATSANTAATQGEQGQILGGIASQNNANVGMQSNINSAQANLAGQVAGGQMNMLGNMAGAAGAAMLLPTPKADGGEVLPALSIPAVGSAATRIGQYFSQNPDLAGTNTTASGQTAPVSGWSTLGKAIGSDINKAASSIYNSMQSPVGNASAAPATAASINGPGAMQSYMEKAKGGKVSKVPVLLSPEERVLTPKQAKKVVEGKAKPMAEGKTVPGTPVVKGAKNDYANDIIPDSLEEGSIVIPRSVTKAANSEQKAIDFVRAHYAKKGLPAAPKKVK